MTAAPAGSQRPLAPLPDPLERNWVWRTIQVVLQNVFVFWLRYRIRGAEHLPRQGGGLLLINHQSFLDPLLVAASLHRPVSYLARENLFRVPVIGWILANTYVMPIRRDAATTEGIREAIRRLEHGYLVGIFPEGTRTRDGSLGPLKPGFLAIIRRSSVPVIPVGISGADEAFPRGTLLPRRRTVRVVVDAPLPTETVEELSQSGRERELIALVSERIQQCMNEARAWCQGGT